MAIKDSAETWVRGKPTSALILVAAVGVVIGGLIGLGAGYKIEQSRTKSDVTRLQNQIKAAGVVTGAGPLGQRVGKVTATAPDSVMLSTKLQGTQQVKTSATTQFEQAAAGKTSDILVGDRLLLTKNASDVIVLPKSSKLGRPVLRASATSFQIAKANGSPGQTIPLKDVKTVSTLTPAKIGDIKTNSYVLAGGKSSSKQVFAAVEVILLPTGSGFAA